MDKDEIIKYIRYKANIANQAGHKEIASNFILLAEEIEQMEDVEKQIKKALKEAKIEEFINDNLDLMQHMSDSERFDNALYCVREALKNLDNKKILKELLKDAERHIVDAEEAFERRLD